MEGHLSVATIEALNKIVRTCRNMRHVIGREPTPEEIAGEVSPQPRMSFIVGADGGQDECRRVGRGVLLALRQ